MKAILALTSALALSLSIPAAAATLVIDGSGELTGVSGLNVGGTFYDVSFLEGTCIGIFSGCDSTTDFAFDTLASATLAGQALLDQVFSPSNPTYDSVPGLTIGCDSWVPECFLVIPFATDGSSVTVLQTVNANVEVPFDRIESVLGAGDIPVTVDSSNVFNAVWARFSPSTAAVPEPSTWAMMLLGFGAIGWVLRRRKRTGLAFREAASLGH